MRELYNVISKRFSINDLKNVVIFILVSWAILFTIGLSQAQNFLDSEGEMFKWMNTSDVLAVLASTNTPTFYSITTNLLFDFSIYSIFTAPFLMVGVILYNSLVKFEDHHGWKRVGIVFPPLYPLYYLYSSDFTTSYKYLRLDDLHLSLSEVNRLAQDSSHTDYISAILCFILYYVFMQVILGVSKWIILGFGKQQKDTA